MQGRKLRALKRLSPGMDQSSESQRSNTSKAEMTGKRVLVKIVILANVL